MPRAEHTQPIRLFFVTATLLFTLAACSFGGRDSGPSQPVDVSHIPNAVPKHEKRTRAGNPSTYVVLGKRYYVLKSSTGFTQRGIASWYGNKFHGKKTSNGETYDMYAMTAAHKTLPIPCYVQVSNLKNGKQVTVRVNDRGPFHENRIIDLSYAAAKKLGITGKGTGLVEIRTVEPGQPAPPTTRVAAKKAPKINTPAAKPVLYLQMGSFIERNNAESLRAQLVLNNVNAAAIQQTTVDRHNIYRVRIGPLTTVEEADRIASQISSLGIGVPTIVID
jgi:rare lipoprotein A